MSSQKPLNEQVIVITGASSGIGLVTARQAAKAGAKLVLTARSERALRDLCDEIRADNGQAVYLAADISDPETAPLLAQLAVETYGGFDTWVNNAGVSIYGKLEEVPVEDMRKLFETNFWGVMYGSLEAAKHLKSRDSLGTIINVGSVLSDRAITLQGAYCASKHALKGFTDVLRMELEHDEAPIVVTLVKPAAIDTPYPHHAKNYLETEPKHNPPVYAPELVTETILYCATHKERELYVGGGGKGMAATGYYAPYVMDKMMEGPLYDGTKSDKAPRPVEQNALDKPSEELDRLKERGDYEGHTRETSLYTLAMTNKLATVAVLGSVATIAALWKKRS